MLELLVGLLQSLKVHKVRCCSEISHRSFWDVMQRPLKRLQSLCDHSGTKNLSSWQTWPNLIVSTLLCHAFFMAIRTASSFLMAGAASTISTGGTSFQCGYSRAASVRSLDHQSFTVCEFLNHQNLGCSQLRNLCLCSCTLNFL